MSCSASSLAPPPTQIKAAWRRSPATPPGPDRRRPRARGPRTRRMAEINAAYAALTRAGETREPTPRRAAEAPARGGGALRARPRGSRVGRAAAPARTRPSRAASTPAHRPPAQPDDDAAGATAAATGQPPLRHDRSARSSGPRSRPGRRSWTASAGHVTPEPPTARRGDGPRGRLRQVPRAHAGRDRGRSSRRTSTGSPGPITRDPELAMAARVIRAELDRRGIRRAHRPPRPGWQSNPFR